MAYMDLRPTMPDEIAAYSGSMEPKPPQPFPRLPKARSIFGIQIPRRKGISFLAGLSGMQAAPPGEGLGGFISGFGSGLSGSLGAGMQLDQMQRAEALKQAEAQRQAQADARAQAMLAETIRHNQATEANAANRVVGRTGGFPAGVVPPDFVGPPGPGQVPSVQGLPPFAQESYYKSQAAAMGGQSVPKQYAPKEQPSADKDAEALASSLGNIIDPQDARVLLKAGALRPRTATMQVQPSYWTEGKMDTSFTYPQETQAQTALKTLQGLASETDPAKLHRAAISPDPLYRRAALRRLAALGVQ